MSLRKPFSPSPAIGTNGCLASISACTVPVEPPWVNTPSNLPCTASASAVTFCAVPSSQLPTTSTISKLPPAASITSRKPIWRSRSTELPGRPRTSRILPRASCPSSLSRNLADMRPISQLVLVDHHHLVGVEHVVERHDHHVVAVGEADDAVEAVGRHGDGDDGVEALVDEVLDGAELRRRRRCRSRRP